MNKHLRILLLLLFFCQNIDARDNLISYNSKEKKNNINEIPIEENEKEINERKIDFPPQKKANPLIEGALKSEQNLIKRGEIVDPEILKEKAGTASTEYEGYERNSDNLEKANSHQSTEVEEPVNVEYQGYSSHYEDLPGGFYDKYIDCGLNEHSIRGRNMTIEEMDQMCEDLKQERREKNILYALSFFGLLIGGIIIFLTIKKSLKPGIEFQKMAEAFNGVYGVINDLQENLSSYNSEQIRNELLLCSFISQKEILKPISIYKWTEFTPITVPLISDKKINVKIALKKTVETIKRLSIELDLVNETDDIFCEGELYKQFEIEYEKNKS
jgi:hypothetical protein